MITLVVELAVNHAERHSLAWAIGGLFMLLAVFTSFHDIAAHLLHYSKPVLQRYVVRIMLMASLALFESMASHVSRQWLQVPIYAIEGWLALRYKSGAIILTTAREWYAKLTC
jgi:Organic solute transporter Ostalpha